LRGKIGSKKNTSNSQKRKENVGQGKQDPYHLGKKDKKKNIFKKRMENVHWGKIEQSSNPMKEQFQKKRKGTGGHGGECSRGKKTSKY